MAVAVAAERAANLTVVVLIDAFADQHRSLAIVAVLNRVGEPAQTAAQEGKFELRHVPDGSFHAGKIRAGAIGSCQPPATPDILHEEVSKNRDSLAEQIDQRTMILLRAS